MDSFEEVLEGVDLGDPGHTDCERAEGLTSGLIENGTLCDAAGLRDFVLAAIPGACRVDLYPVPGSRAVRVRVMTKSARRRRYEVGFDVVSAEICEELVEAKLQKKASI
jgi:hypothetical protein